MVELYIFIIMSQTLMQSLLYEDLTSLKIYQFKPSIQYVWGQSFAWMDFLDIYRLVYIHCEQIVLKLTNKICQVCQNNLADTI